MLLFNIHRVLFIGALGAIVAKIFVMLSVGSWEASSVTDAAVGFGFVFWNILAFIPFLFFARKAYASISLAVIDVLFFVAILYLSIEIDWEIYTGTDAQTALVYVVGPPLQFALLIVPAIVHIAAYFRTQAKV